MNRYAGPLLAAAALVALDQATKIWVAGSIPLFDGREIVRGFANLVHVRNTGVAFSLMARFDPRWLNPLLIGVTTAAVAGMLAYLRLLPQHGPAPWGLGLIVGGAVGNLVDRIRLGYVVDFLDVYWKHHHWPAFNVADIGITAGVVLLALDMLLCSKEGGDAPRPR